MNPKNGLGELLELLILTTLHFGKDLSLLHSAKCSVSTQLTYIQKIIQFNKGAISTIKGFTKHFFLNVLKYLSTLGIEFLQFKNIL